MKKYHVIAIEPLKPPIEVDMSMEEIQTFVGGELLMIPLYENKVALMNKEAKAQNLPRNRQILIQRMQIPITLVGNFVIIKDMKTDFENLQDEEAKKAKEIFYESNETILI